MSIGEGAARPVAALCAGTTEGAVTLAAAGVAVGWAMLTVLLRRLQSAYRSVLFPEPMSSAKMR